MQELDVLVFDTTMRDGEQQPMLSFRDDEKIALAYQLERLGVFEMDLMPSIDGHERMLIGLLNDTRLRDRIGVATMAHPRYVEQALDVNARVSYLFVHVSDKLMGARGKTREQNLGDIVECVDLARSGGLIVDFCGGDGTRADMGYLSEVLTEIGPKIRFYQPCDTSGLMTPETARIHVAALQKVIGSKIVVHFHNDNGQAADSVIAALKEGARGFDASLLGIGERAGNVATEDVLLKLRDQGYHVKGVDYDQLPITLDMVRKMCRGVDPPSVNLERRYPNVSGIHARALCVERAAFDLEYTPEITESFLFFGKHSGASNYELLFGDRFTKDEYREMRDVVKRRSREELRDFTAKEIREMFATGAPDA